MHELVFHVEVVASYIIKYTKLKQRHKNMSGLARLQRLFHFMFQSFNQRYP